MSWELFQNLGHRNINCFTVRITPQEKIFFNRAIFYALQDLKNTVAKILYNNETKQFCVVFEKDNVITKNNAHLSVLGLNQKNMYIHPKGCFKFFKLVPPKQDYKIEASFDDLKTIKFYYLG
jgi:hypothetical protein